MKKSKLAAGVQASELAVSFLTTTFSQDFSAMSTTPPPSFDIDASSGLTAADTLALASANQHSPHYPRDSEVASAALPGECSNSLSHELSTNFLREKSSFNSGEYQNSPFGGAESNQSFEEEEHELHDFLEKDELLLMQEMFKSMDLDGAGKIQWEHARLVMAKMGRKLTDDQFAKLVDRYDVDKNGNLEFSEFCSMYLDHMKRRVKNNDTLLEIFAFLDRKECGRVSREDVETCLELANIHLPQEDLDIMLQSMIDDDGTFCFADLVDIIN